MTEQPELFTVGRNSMTGEITITPALSFSPDPPAPPPHHDQPRIDPAPRTVGRMHCGSLATSKRLQDTLAVLQDGEWHTTREIRLVTNSEAVHSDLAALRANGVDYECKPAGGKKYAYRLKPG